MELGQRLKQARLEAGLSQRQLCGEEITRNMLSQIENGSARPSMSTLAYLAQRLEKPISYFLQEDAAYSPNRQCMEQVRHAYTEGRYADGVQLLEQYRSPDRMFDPERWLLEVLCLMGVAQQAAAEGKTVYSAALLERAGQAGAQTPYYTDALERERILLLSSSGTQSPSALADQLPPDRREQYLRAAAALEIQDYARCTAVLEAAPDDTAQWHYYRGEAARGQMEFALAAEHYLRAEAAYPGQTARALEICYRELGDYKNAYLYACKQRED